MPRIQTLHYNLLTMHEVALPAMHTPTPARGDCMYCGAYETTTTSTGPVCTHCLTPEALR